MTALVRWGKPLGHPTGVLVTPSDALALSRDTFLHGDVFVKPTGELRDGEPVYERIPPHTIEARVSGQLSLELGIVHLDGVPWYTAPLPRRWHRCSAWTTAAKLEIERCACGGFRYTSGPAGGTWIRRNSRRKT